MITCYFRQGDAIAASYVPVGGELPQGTLWIDLYSPSIEEEKQVEAQLGLELPSREEIWKNQVLNRFFRANDVYYMPAALITKVNSPYPETSSVTFVKSRQCLVTMRYIAPTSFANFAQRLVQSPRKFQDSGDILEGLLEEVINRIAHNLEIVVGELDSLSHIIFAAGGDGTNISQAMKDVLRRLGTAADLNSKINESIQSINRMLAFFKSIPENNQEVNTDLNILITDAAALTAQTAFLSDKLNFQLDATLGMINVEQNVIIKIFSVVAVFFMPPTLISSIYGMNFEHMPELQWPYGYPMAIGFMLLCATIPYFYFRRKGWL